MPTLRQFRQLETVHNTPGTTSGKHPADDIIVAIVGKAH
jgi:hypothetical protein